MPSPSPLVTPEMGERLCRMASQHHLSDYNRYKRGIHPNQLNQENQNQSLTNYSQKHHRHHRHHHHHHRHHHNNNSNNQTQHQQLSDQIPLNQLPTHLNQLTDQPSSSYPIHSQPADLSLSQPNQSSNPAPITQSNPDHPSNTIPSNLSLQPTLEHSDPTQNLIGEQIPLSNDLANTPQFSAFSTAASPIDPSLIGSSPHPSQPSSGIPATVNGTHDLNPPPPVKVQSVKTSETHPMNISPVIPPELTSALLFMLKTANDRAGANKLPVDLFDLTGAEAAQATDLFWQYFHQRLASHQANPTPELSSWIQGAEDQKLGNLLLSSCPGKKVRMNETPAQRLASGSHRSPICRDLKSDLSRAHSIGIRAVVCCLDDQELEYLGSPWMEYQSTAQECGLEVIRIPIAEGFAPQRGINEINEVLDRVISAYTSNGVDVLCHCRGGVGRAGLVACCWMLKIGLINKPVFVSDPLNAHLSQDQHHIGSSSFQDHFQHQFQHPPADAHDVLSFVDGNQLAPKNSVLAQVEKVIEVIRRRRSIKAIETPQQVHFIIQYANWLDNLKENYTIA